MTPREPKPATYLAAVLASETVRKSKDVSGKLSPYQAAKDAETLVRLGKRAARIAVQQCNGIERYDSKAGRVLASWTEADEARAERQKDAIEKAATAILNPYGATKVSASGDPRGFCLRFRLASGRSNSFDANTWGV